MYDLYAQQLESWSLSQCQHMSESEARRNGVGKDQSQLLLVVYGDFLLKIMNCQARIVFESWGQTLVYTKRRRSWMQAGWIEKS